MSDTVIRLENIGKQYRIGDKQDTHKTLRDGLADALVSPFRRASKLLHGQSRRAGEPDQMIWALKDISYEIKRGEVVGFIGRNGAGKSTLLKVLSRITEPTEGYAEIRGRVGSLLEVGTGFHPELTGRENIYLNGAILGMKRTEIARKFDEIISFAEIDRFIDTPVKRYSSGMYLRLAFAVAAHLEPEILLVDEVLAVGDASFQKKCLGKMEGVAKEGRTVVFVSHNMGAIAGLCGKTIFLRRGCVESIGPTAEVIAYYLHSEVNAVSEDRYKNDDNNGGYVLIKPEKELRFICGGQMAFGFEIVCPRPCSNATAGLVIYDLFGDPVVGASSKFQGICGNGESSRWQINCEMGNFPLNSGRYYITIWFGDKYKDCAKFSKTFSLHIEPSDPFGWGNKVPEGWGHFFWKPQWHISPP